MAPPVAGSHSQHFAGLGPLPCIHKPTVNPNSELTVGSTFRLTKASFRPRRTKVRVDPALQQLRFIRIPAGGLAAFVAHVAEQGGAGGSEAEDGIFHDRLSGADGSYNMRSFHELGVIL